MYEIIRLQRNIPHFILVLQILISTFAISIESLTLYVSDSENIVVPSTESTVFIQWIPLISSGQLYIDFSQVTRKATVSLMWKSLTPSFFSSFTHYYWYCSSGTRVIVNKQTFISCPYVSIIEPLTFKAPSSKFYMTGDYTNNINLSSNSTQVTASYLQLMYDGAGNDLTITITSIDNSQDVTHAIIIAIPVVCIVIVIISITAVAVKLTRHGRRSTICSLNACTNCFLLRSHRAARSTPNAVPVIDNHLAVSAINSGDISEVSGQSAASWSQLWIEANKNDLPIVFMDAPDDIVVNVSTIPPPAYNSFRLEKGKISKQSFSNEDSSFNIAKVNVLPVLPSYENVVFFSNGVQETPNVEDEISSNNNIAGQNNSSFDNTDEQLPHQ